ncbi:MAG: AgmX/PglI C-terminal domain-containing protein [bacterium]
MKKTYKVKKDTQIHAQLPLEYRLSFFNKNQRDFLYPLICSLIIHLMIIFYVKSVTLPSPDLHNLSEVSERFVNLIIKESPISLQKITEMRIEKESPPILHKPKKEIIENKSLLEKSAQSKPIQPTSLPPKPLPPKPLPPKPPPPKPLPEKLVSQSPLPIEKEKDDYVEPVSSQEKADQVASLTKPGIDEVKKKRLDIHELGILGRISTSSATEGNDSSIQELDLLSDEIAQNGDDLLTQLEQLDVSSDAAGTGLADLDELLQNQEHNAQEKLDKIFNSVQVANADKIILPDEEKILESLKIEPAKAQIISGPSIDKSRSEEVILQVVSSYKSSIAYCYQRELKNNPTLKGRITVKFSIGTADQVLSAEIYSSELNNPNLEACLIDMILRWRFPAGAQAVTTVIYPFIFFPRL